MHQNTPESLQIGTRADLTIILAHGRGRSPDDMRALADRLDIDNVRYVFPVATNNTWYPALFQDAVADNEPWLSAAIAHYDDLVLREIAAGTPAERIFIGGFSQGACLTAEFLARHPRRYAGAILWTGGLIGPDGMTWPENQEFVDMPAYISTSENDPWVPPQRVRETHSWLRRCGAMATMMIFKERDHGVIDEEIGPVRGMIERQRRALIPV
jgi:predicted esterase